ncbi:polysaccharide deacetylase family protein [Desulfovibrio sp. OttesenSCG-928-O18]|nr:polysaccharide deacetylase family protein [Desulfovibrio sp. OttesenSCG-928-O18]
MKKTAFVLVLLLLGATSAFAATGGAAALWTAGDLDGTPQDLERRAFRELRLPVPHTPRILLSPLDATEDGVVRRVRVTSERKVAAITFDLCELETNSNGYDYRIVNFLRRENIPATLFMGGKWMSTHPERVMQVMACPFFEIGNHAWSHGNFALMEEDMARSQVLRTQAQYEMLRDELAARAASAGFDAAFMSAIPKKMTLFRLPYGRSSPKALRLLGSLGLQVIQWDVVAERLPGDNAEPQVAEECAAEVRPGSILLFHANGVPQNSHLLLERVVELLRAKGYAFVTVSELLRMGQAEKAKDGYFNTPGDNLELDAKFGTHGTGVK